ncbi:MAG: ABC transporter permease, partial [Rhizobiaceae bacterium]|nr:ABC transporter permease [Rhizobiaceae bacterium]
MTASAITPRDMSTSTTGRNNYPVVWLIALAVFALLWLAPVPGWIDVYPKAWEIPASRWISAAMKWLVNEASFGLFTFTEFTRFLASIIEAPYRLAMSLLATGFLSGQGSSAVQVAPPLSWVAVIGIAALMGHAAGGRALALLVFACFAFILVFGQWQSAMATLASVLVAVPIGIAGGLLLGIAAYRHPR